jgi:phosphoribosylanthranilate isomerase
VFYVKICGITTPDDAIMVARAGADAIGLNFYPKSPRSIDQEQARAIVAAVPATIVKVGLFVNAPADLVCQRCDRLGLDIVQLHGDETPEYLKLLGTRPVIRVFRIGAEGLRSAFEYLERCQTLGCPPPLVLFDSRVSGTFGGTGAVGEWQALAAYKPSPPVRPAMVLAGGLTPDNVAEAIRSVRPQAVDTASGVETAPGRKSAELVLRFVTAARQALGLAE